MSATVLPGPLQGTARTLAAIMLAFGNLMAVLDMNIANVSIPNIAGGLAVAPSQGTWVITSYGIAEAVMVPLTGWLARSFGQVRVFCVSMAAFGICSALCGMAHSFYLLVFLRVLQGLSGGPMIPLSQTLLLGIFPKGKAVTAGTIWTVGGTIGPIFAPLLGGVICDRFSWPWIFYINVPFALACAGGSWLLLRDREVPMSVQRIDTVGLALLVIWVGALQITLDRGHELDWFGSPFIIGCLLVAIVGFVAFVVWELTDRQPAVDLSVFRSRGYTMLLLTLCVGQGCFSASVVLSPLWMQTALGYTPTRAALAVCFAGAVITTLASSIQKLMLRVDKRALICVGALIMAATMEWRATFASNVTFELIRTSHLFLGLGLAFFILPIFSTLLSNLPPAQLPAGAGLMSFLRTTSIAFATSIVTTVWSDGAIQGRVRILDRYNEQQGVAGQVAAGLPSDQALQAADAVVQGESIMLATNHVYALLGALLFVAAALVWLAPRAAGAPAPGKT
jgi:DHA2 family multidrug resistance protein